MNKDKIIITLSEKEIAELKPANIPEQDHSDLPAIGWNYPHMKLIAKTRSSCVFEGNGITIEIPMHYTDLMDLPVDKEYILNMEYGTLKIYEQPEPN